MIGQFVDCVIPGIKHFNESANGLELMLSRIGSNIVIFDRKVINLGEVYSGVRIFQTNLHNRGHRHGCLGYDVLSDFCPVGTTRKMW